MNIQTPNARNTDVITSHLAGQEVTESGLRASQQKEVLEMVRKHEGLTSKELAITCDADRYMIARRLPDLEGVHIKKGEARTCSIGKRKAVTWWLIED